MAWSVFPSPMSSASSNRRLATRARAPSSWNGSSLPAQSSSDSVPCVSFGAASSSRNRRAKGRLPPRAIRGPLGDPRLSGSADRSTAIATPATRVHSRRARSEKSSCRAFAARSKGSKGSFSAMTASRRLRPAGRPWRTRREARQSASWQAGGRPTVRCADSIPSDRGERQPDFQPVSLAWERQPRCPSRPGQSGRAPQIERPIECSHAERGASVPLLSRADHSLVSAREKQKPSGAPWGVV